MKYKRKTLSLALVSSCAFTLMLISSQSVQAQEVSLDDTSAEENLNQADLTMSETRNSDQSESGNVIHSEPQNHTNKIVETVQEGDTVSPENREVASEKENDSDQPAYVDVNKKFEVDGVSYRVLEHGEDYANVQLGDNYQPVPGEGSFNVPEKVHYEGNDYIVTKIGTNAFNSTLISSSSHTQVQVADTVESIGQNAFHSSKVNQLNFTENSQLKHIEQGAFSWADIKELELPNSVNTIGNRAFSFAENLQTLIIKPESELQTIGDDAFSRATKLREIFIPKGVTSIGRQAFTHTQALESIHVDLDNPNYKSVDGVLFDKNMTRLIAYPANRSGNHYQTPETLKEIEEYAFAGSHQLESISLNENLVSIGDFAFQDSKIKEIKLPSSLEHIGRLAFQRAEHIEKLTVPGKVNSFGNYPFYQMTNLKEITFNDGIKELPNNTLSGGTPALERIIIEDPEAVIEKGTFNLSNPQQVKYVVANETVKEQLVQTLDIKPDQVEVKGKSNQKEESQKEEKDVNTQSNPVETSQNSEGTPQSSEESNETEKADNPDESYEHIEIHFKKGDTFKDAEGLDYRILSLEGQTGTVQLGNGRRGIQSNERNLIVPETVEIDGYTFRVTEIASSAFYRGEGSTNLPNLQTVTLPASIELLQNDSFRDSGNIQSVYFAPNSQLKEIGERAFYFSNIAEITIPASVEIINNRAFSFTENLATINIPKDSQLKVIGHQAFTTNKQLKTIYVPKDVELIGDRAFSETFNLAEIVAHPDNLHYSSLDGVLYNKDQTILIEYPAQKKGDSFVVDKTIKELKPYAFANARHLKEIRIEAPLDEIPTNAFRNLENLVSIELAEGPTHVGRLAFYKLPELKSMTLPDSVTSYGNHLFSNVENIEEITFGKGMEQFDRPLFYGATPHLNRIIFKGENIQIDKNALTLDDSTLQRAHFTVVDDASAEQLKAIGIPEAHITVQKLEENTEDNIESEQPSSPDKEEEKVPVVPTPEEEKDVEERDEAETDKEAEPENPEEPSNTETERSEESDESKSESNPDLSESEEEKSDKPSQSETDSKPDHEPTKEAEKDTNIQSPSDPSKPESDLQAKPTISDKTDKLDFEPKIDLENSNKSDKQKGETSSEIDNKAKLDKDKTKTSSKPGLELKLPNKSENKSKIKAEKSEQENKSEPDIKSEPHLNQSKSERVEASTPKEASEQNLNKNYGQSVINQSAVATLPETGEKDAFSIFGASALAILAGLGLVSSKSREEEIE